MFSKTWFRACCPHTSIQRRAMAWCSLPCDHGCHSMSESHSGRIVVDLLSACHSSRSATSQHWTSLPATASACTRCICAVRCCLACLSALQQLHLRARLGARHDKVMALSPQPPLLSAASCWAGSRALGRRLRKRPGTPVAATRTICPILRHLSLPLPGPDTSILHTTIRGCVRLVHSNHPKCRSRTCGTAVCRRVACGRNRNANCPSCSSRRATSAACSRRTPEDPFLSAAPAEVQLVSCYLVQSRCPSWCCTCGWHVRKMTMHPACCQEARHGLGPSWSGWKIPYHRGPLPCL
mmetsp:Transcript_113635/g.212887  ORF Transcript_113635/g.212887 Transcript_113635/m.212887 type:complete len:295 (-) Transcript_113635:415-1299(-)